MRDPVALTDITLVTYPSNHVLCAAPKIMLLGKGLDWKDEIVKQTNNFWADAPVMFFYMDDDEYNSDNLSWLFLNIKNSDFIIGRLSDDTSDTALITPFITMHTTFLLYDIEKPFQDWFMALNPNKDIIGETSIILKIKDKWALNKFVKPLQE